MHLNLPILHLLQDSHNILIAGAGGGFDIYAGLPLYFQLRQMGKNVHLANYSFVPYALAKLAGSTVDELPSLLLGARGRLRVPIGYHPEGHLAEWFAVAQGREEIIWMFDNPAAEALALAYRHLVKKLALDTIILVDGGIDSLMRGDEQGPGSLLEDTISLVAIEELDVPVKLLATIGFGSETEEGVSHYHALENIAALTKVGAFLGSCSLIPQMDGFALYEAACRYAWEAKDSDPPQIQRSLSHISTRIIPAALGEFGDYRLYPHEHSRRFVSPLMNIYWFFDALKVVERSLAADVLRGSLTKEDAKRDLMLWLYNHPNKRSRAVIPY